MSKNYKPRHGMCLHPTHHHQQRKIIIVPDEVARRAASWRTVKTRFAREVRRSSRESLDDLWERVS